MRFIQFDTTDPVCSSWLPGLHSWVPRGLHSFLGEAHLPGPSSPALQASRGTTIRHMFMPALSYTHTHINFHTVTPYHNPTLILIVTDIHTQSLIITTHTQKYTELLTHTPFYTSHSHLQLLTYSVSLRYKLSTLTPRLTHTHTHKHSHMYTHTHTQSSPFITFS